MIIRKNSSNGCSVNDKLFTIRFPQDEQHRPKNVERSHPKQTAFIHWKEKQMQKRTFKIGKTR